MGGRGGGDRQTHGAGIGVARPAAGTPCTPTSDRCRGREPRRRGVVWPFGGISAGGLTRWESGTSHLRSSGDPAGTTRSPTSSRSRLRTPPRVETFHAAPPIRRACRGRASMSGCLPTARQSLGEASGAASAWMSESIEPRPGLEFALGRASLEPMRTLTRRRALPRSIATEEPYARLSYAAAPCARGRRGSGGTRSRMRSAASADHERHRAPRARGSKARGRRIRRWLHASNTGSRARSRPRAPGVGDRSAREGRPPAARVAAE